MAHNRRDSRLGQFPRGRELTGAFARKSAAALIAIMFMGSTLITPLYPIYREAFGFSEVTLTLVYSVYVVGNLSALLFLGRLSDQIGRRRVALSAIALAAVSALLFVYARGPSWLFWARMLSGLAIGLAAGTATAWIAELDPRKDKSHATLLATVANSVGLAVGPLLAGTLAQYGPRPLQLSLVVYLVLLGICAALVNRTHETVGRPVPALRAISLEPRIGVPHTIRAHFVAPAVTAFATFALFGFYYALAPSILAESLQQPNHAVGGSVVFELAAVAAAAIVASRRLASRTAMFAGLVLLLPSVALLVLAQAFASMPILVIGTALSGVSGALGYRGSLQVVNDIAPAHRRAEVVSCYYVACFFGNSVPVVGVGVLTAASGSMRADLIFACTIALFSAAALVFGLRNR